MIRKSTTLISSQPETVEELVSMHHSISNHQMNAFEDNINSYFYSIHNYLSEAIELIKKTANTLRSNACNLYILM